MQEHFHYTKQLPQLQRLFERVHKEIKKLYVRFIPTRISQRRNINQQLQSDTTLITVCLVGKMLGFISERTWYRFVVANLFPKQIFPDRSRFNRICRQLQWVIQLLRFPFTRKFVHQANYTIIDSLPLPLCHAARSNRVKRLKEHAGFGILCRQKGALLRIQGIPSSDGYWVRGRIRGLLCIDSRCESNEDTARTITTPVCPRGQRIYQRIAQPNLTNTRDYVVGS